MRMLTSWPEWWPFIVAPVSLLALACLAYTTARDADWDLDGTRWDRPERCDVIVWPAPYDWAREAS